MEIKGWGAVREPDLRTLRFMPGGLGLGIQLSAEDSADYQQRLVAALDLAPEVGDDTRRTFERLRLAWVYGVLNYDLFTVISDAAWLVFEQALREVFLEHHRNGATFVDLEGHRHTVTPQRFDEIYQYARRHKDQRLQLGRGPATMAFDAGFTDLRRWARRVRLLRGQRVRSYERALGRFRNDVAHRDSFDLSSPVQAFRTLADLREWINQLWGTSTPNGRRYPAPVTREITVIARARTGVAFASAPATELHAETNIDGTPFDPHDEWEYVIVRAVLDQPHIRSGQLDRFDSLHEVTPYPTDLLWGPGTRDEARRWLLSIKPQPDDCDVLDRLFAIRHDQGRMWQPMRLAIAAGLPTAEQTGVWYMVRADFPEDAALHVRNRITETGCDRKGFCETCGKAETILAGVPFARAFPPVERAAAVIGLPDLAWHAPGFMSSYERATVADAP